MLATNCDKMDRSVNQNLSELILIGCNDTAGICLIVVDDGGCPAVCVDVDVSNFNSLLLPPSASSPLAMLAMAVIDGRRGAGRVGRIGFAGTDGAIVDDVGVAAAVPIGTGAPANAN